jgi:hypothetical protein
MEETESPRKPATGENVKGVLFKRKDFLGIDEHAQAHPNRTYYFKRTQDLNGIIETCSKKLQVMLLFAS